MLDRRGDGRLETPLVCNPSSCLHSNNSSTCLDNSCAGTGRVHKSALCDQESWINAAKGQVQLVAGDRAKHFFLFTLEKTRSET